MGWSEVADEPASFEFGEILHLLAHDPKASICQIGDLPVGGVEESDVHGIFKGRLEE